MPDQTLLQVQYYLCNVIVFSSNRLFLYILSLQMWTPLQVFSDGFVHTDKFQLPLYHGIPNKVLLYDYF